MCSNSSESLVSRGAELLLIKTIYSTFQVHVFHEREGRMAFGGSAALQKLTEWLNKWVSNFSEESERSNETKGATSGGSN